MKADDVGAGGGKRAGERVHRLHHQVHIERRLAAVALDAMRLQRLRHHRADGQVRHVVIVHDVEVDPVRAGGQHVPDFLAQAGEVGGQNRWGDAIHGLTAVTFAFRRVGRVAMHRVANAAAA